VSHSCPVKEDSFAHKPLHRDGFRPLVGGNDLKCELRGSVLLPPWGNRRDSDEIRDAPSLRISWNTLSHRAFKRCPARYPGARRLRGSTCWDQFLFIVFAQLTCRESLRDSKPASDMSLSTSRSRDPLVRHRTSSAVVHHPAACISNVSVRPFDRVISSIEASDSIPGFANSQARNRTLSNSQRSFSSSSNMLQARSEGP
jgi:hypothetical protein